MFGLATDVLDVSMKLHVDIMKSYEEPAVGLGLLRARVRARNRDR